MNNPISPNLARYVRGTAYNIARRRNCPDYIEDIEQDLVIALLELYAEEPDAFSLPNKDLMARVANKIDWQYRSAQVHTQRIGIEDRPVDPTDPDSPTLTEHAGRDPWPSANLAFAVRQALSALSPECRSIALGLAAGYSAREIAPDLGVSLRTVYNRMHGSIAAALTGV